MGSGAAMVVTRDQRATGAEAVDDCGANDLGRADLILLAGLLHRDRRIHLTTNCGLYVYRLLKTFPWTHDSPIVDFAFVGSRRYTYKYNASFWSLLYLVVWHLQYYIFRCANEGHLSGSHNIGL